MALSKPLTFAAKTNLRQSGSRPARSPQILESATENPPTLDPQVFRYLGFSFIWAWIYLACSSPALLPSVSAGTGSPSGRLFAYAYTAIFATNALASLVGAVLARHPIIARLRPFLRIIAPLLTMVGTVLVALVGREVLSSLIWLYCGSVAAGIGSAWIVLMWGERYATLGARYVSILTPGSLLLGVVVYVVALSLPMPLAIVITAFLPVLSALMLQSVVTTENTPPEIITVSPFRTLWRLFLGTAVYACAFGFLRAFATILEPQLFGVSNRLWLLSSGAAALLITIAAIVVRWHIDIIRVAYSFVLPLMTAGFLLLTAFGQGNYVLSGAVAMTGYTCFDILMWILHSQIASRYRQALMIFGWGRFFSYGGLLLGVQLCLLVSKSMGGAQYIGTISMWGVFALVVTAAFVLRERDLPCPEGAPPPVAPQEPDSLQAALERQCGRLAIESGLSPRETEIFVLLARGYSLPYVQKTLRISRGTASTHAEHIYRKLGVHTRQELLALIDAVHP